MQEMNIQFADLPLIPHSAFENGVSRFAPAQDSLPRREISTSRKFVT
jgi:hypothetical protein